MSPYDFHIQWPHLNPLGGAGYKGGPGLEDGDEGGADSCADGAGQGGLQGGERGRVWGAGPISPYLGQAANQLPSHPSQAPTSHIHTLSAMLNPQQAIMPKTPERLGPDPSSHQMPQDLAGGPFTVWTLSSKGPASAEPSWGGGATAGGCPHPLLRPGK